MPKFSKTHFFLVAIAVASLSGLAIPHTWAEVLSPQFLLPALAAVATTIVGIMSKAPEPK